VVVAAYLVPKSLPTQKGSKLLQKLWAFERASDIPVGSKATLSFEVSTKALALADLATGDYVSAPGEYELRFSHGDPEHERTVALTLAGAQQVIEAFPTA
jgi:hypothetical protein